MNYLTKRILTYLVVFFLALNIAFFLPRLAPGSASQILAASNRFSPQSAPLIAARLGLNQPLYVQYYDFLKNVFSWPPYFGVSYQFYPQPVTTLFAERFGWTLLLVASSTILAAIISYVMAGISSLRRGGKFEFGSLYSSIMLHAIPVYWTAMILLWVFSVWLGILPVFGNVGFSPGTGLDYISSVITHAILPVTALTLVQVGNNFLLLRGSTQEVLKSDYVLAAKSRGLRDGTIASTYILRNSLLPFVSLLTFSLASIVSVAVLVEGVFGYPGVGDLIVDAVVTRDYPVLDGSLFFLSILVIAGGLVGDILLLRLDPRLKK